MLVMLAPRQVSADTDVQLYGSFGMMTDDSFKFNNFLWFAGLNLDLSLNNILMLSPELNLVTHKFKFKAFLLEPAVLLNLKLSENFFVGGGITKFLAIASGDYYGSTDMAVKLNIGIISEYFKFRIFLITPFNDFFKDNLIGFSAGISF